MIAHEIQAALAEVGAEDCALAERIGAALKGALGDAGFDVWFAWNRDAGFDDERSLRDLWEQLKGGETLELVLDEVRQRGPDGGAPAPHATATTPEAGASIALAEREALATALKNAATEDNVALAFAVEHQGALLFNHRRRGWHTWDGTRWREEETGLAFEFARRLARRVSVDGKAAPSKAAFARGVEAFARSDRRFAMVGDEFDRDPMLLNTPAGTIDLRTGRLRRHRRDDLLTKSTRVGPSRARRPLFEKFMREITCGDASLIDYLQRGLGACLSGAINDHWLMFWYGDGRNGKNTLGELVQEVLGDYAKKIPAQTLMRDARGERHPTEVANLLGTRLAFSSEVGDGDSWHESRIKELTGDKALSARFMRGDFFEFPRTHKNIVYGNHKPLLTNVDPAIAARLHLVPFAATFTADAGTLDPAMPDKLRAESGAVLDWLLEGHAKWLEDGTLQPCKVVADATREYLESQSPIDVWIAERCETLKLPDERPTKVLDLANALYKDYSAWKQDRGEDPANLRKWGEAMSRRFVKVTADGVRYRGVRLRTEGYGTVTRITPLKGGRYDS